MKVLYTGASVTLAIAVCFLVGFVPSCWCNKPPKTPAPALAAPQPPVVCVLPAAPTLPTASTVDAGNPKLFCYSIEGAVAVAARDDKMRQWIKEAIARCGPPERNKDAGRSDSENKLQQ